MPRLDRAIDGRDALSAGLADRIEGALGRRPVSLRPLAGGCIAQASVVEMPEGTRLVAKHGMTEVQGPGEAATLTEEASMLRDLRRRAPMLPIPDVHHGEADLLIMDFLPGIAGPGPEADEHLADLVAMLHGVDGSAFGYGRPTPVGPLMRPNDWSEDWRAFFRDRRLLYLGRLTMQVARITPDCFARLERLCARLEEWLPAGTKPSLIHGDLWGGNILAEGGRVTGLIDPAIFYADAELEIAFMSLFGGPGPRFLDRYREHRPIDPGFEDTRRPIYQLEPLLAHAWFFGGGYGARVDDILRRYVG